MNQTLPPFPTYFTPPGSFPSSPGFDGTSTDFYGLQATHGFDAIESDGASSGGGGFDMTVDRQTSSNMGYFSANQAAINYNTHAYNSRPTPTSLNIPSFTYPSSRPSSSSASGFLDMPGPSTYAGTSYLNTNGVNGDTERLVKLEKQREEGDDDDDDDDDESDNDNDEDDDDHDARIVELNGGEDGAMGEDGDGAVDNEEPLYVNAKQYHRILKRRIARQRLEELNRLSRSRKPYLHESRHRHACSRPRGKGGRFLTADEIEALKREQQASLEGPLDSRPSTGEDGLESA